MNLYIIQSHDGKFLRSVGYGDSRKNGGCWVDKVEKAKIYTKLGAAKGRVSWWINNFENYPAPILRELLVTMGKVIKIDATQVKIKKLKSELQKYQRYADYIKNYRNEDKTDYTPQITAIELKLKELCSRN